MTTFNRQRLTLARKSRGLKKQQLADLASLSARSITSFETGENIPAEQTVEVLARTLNFPREFFFGQELDEPDLSTINFRAMTKMTASERDVATTASVWAIAINRWLEENWTPPVADLPDLSHETDPEAAAGWLRGMWGLEKKSISNMVHLLESKGIRVFSLAIDSRHVDAFSMWHNGTPFIFLNTRKSSERSRFDAAHELAHLLLHRAAAAKGQELEREANAFASAFLIPRNTIPTSARGASLTRLLQMKSQWGVSVAALAHRLREVNLLTAWQYRSLCIEIGRAGYSSCEPHPAERETSLLFRKIFQSLRDNGKSSRVLAEHLRLSQSDLSDLTFGTALAVMTSESTASRTRNTTPPKLTVHQGGKDCPTRFSRPQTLV